MINSLQPKRPGTRRMSSSEDHKPLFQGPQSQQRRQEGTNPNLDDTDIKKEAAEDKTASAIVETNGCEVTVREGEGTVRKQQ